MISSQLNPHTFDVNNSTIAFQSVGCKYKIHWESNQKQKGETEIEMVFLLTADIDRIKVKWKEQEEAAKMMDCSIIEHMNYVKEKWELSYIIRENRLKRNILVCQRKKYLNQRKIEIRNGCMKYECIQRAFNCSKTVIETLEQDVNHVQRQQQKHQKNINEHTFNLLQCFQCCFQQLKAYFVQTIFHDTKDILSSIKFFKTLYAFFSSS